MVRFQRTGSINQDKADEAVQWALKVAEYINKQFPEATLTVFLNRFGVQNAIHWVADFKQLADLDAYQLKIGADEGYKNLVKETTGLFGEISDSVINTI